MNVLKIIISQGIAIKLKCLKCLIGFIAKWRVDVSEVVKKKENIFELIEKSKDQFSKALPEHVRSDKFIRTMLTEIRTNTALQKCNPYSILGASMQAAGLGLEVGQQLGLAYLVPYGSECKLSISYRGLVALILRSGQVTSISAHVVYDNEEYEISLGTNKRITHIPKMSGKGKELFYYATARMANGDVMFDYMDLDELARIEKMSKGNVWKTHRVAMCKKSVIKKLAKLLPLSTDYLVAANNDDSSFDSGEIETFETTAIDQLNSELENE